MKLLLIFLFSSTFSFSQEPQIVLIGNHASLCFSDTNFIYLDKLPVLDDIKVIMLFSGATSQLNNTDLDTLLSFVNKGGGLYIGAENWPLQSESKQVTTKMYNKETYGTYTHEFASCPESAGNLNLQDVDSIPAGTTTVAFPMDYRLKVEAWIEDQPLILSGKWGKGRIIIDGGYSRFYCDNSNGDSSQLLEIILSFLSGK